MIAKSVLEDLYITERLSMMEIASRLNSTPHKVEWWMQKYQMPRRSWSEATYVKRNADGDPFTIKTDLSPSEQFLLGLGLGLYWGEGNKASPNAVRLGNTDPQVIKSFVKFLREICGVQEQKIRFWLQIFQDIEKEEAMRYWLNELNVSRDRFLPTIVVSPSQGKGTYKNKSKYGVVTVVVCNKKLRDWILDQLDAQHPN